MIASAFAIWFIVAVVLVLLFLAAAADSFGFAFWVTVIGFAVLQFLTTADPWARIAAHPRATAGLAAAYLPLGVGWSLFRWWKFLQSHAAALRVEKVDWRPSDYHKTWDQYVSDLWPRADRHKDRIAFWIAYWPFSALAYLLLDFLRDLAARIYERLSGVYQAMAERVQATLRD